MLIVFLIIYFILKLASWCKLKFLSKLIFRNSYFWHLLTSFCNLAYDQPPKRYFGPFVDDLLPLKMVLWLASIVSIIIFEPTWGMPTIFDGTRKA
jgi:hypothetical protein